MTTIDVNDELRGDAIAQMKQDIRRQEHLLRVQKQIIKILETLPDDDARRRVVAAVAILLGHREP